MSPDLFRFDFSSVIRTGDGVIVGQACAEPQTLLEALVSQRASFPGARLFLGIHYTGIIKPEHADHLRLAAYCGAGRTRALADAGVLEIHPHPYSRFAALIRERRIPSDVVLLQVSPPDAQGKHSMGLGAEYLVPALDRCRAIIAEINEQVPWTHSDRLFQRDDFDLVIESSRPPAAAPGGEPGELETAITRHAAAYVPDGAVIETGLGALPDAILHALSDRRDLSLHSGAAGDGVAELMQRGAMAQADCGLLLGTKKLFDFAHKNPQLRLRSTEYTHDPGVLGRIERFVAINSAIEVDLTGQVNAEVAKGSYIGAVGGALDFIRAANHSPGGVSILALPAARVVAKLSGPVSTPRSEAGVIVTEHGAADLRGLTLRERVRRMIGIATPGRRGELERTITAGSEKLL